MQCKDGMIFMFDYAREVVEKKIEDGYKKYNIQNDKRQELSKKILDISSCQQAANGLESNKISLGLSVCLLLGSCCFMLINGVSIIPVLLVVLSLVKSIQSIGEIKIDKIILEEERKKCLEIIKELLSDSDHFKNKEIELNRENIELTKEILDSKRSVIECEMKKTLDLIRDDKLMLQEFSDYEKTDKYFSSGKQFCMKQAKNEEEFRELIKLLNICNTNSLESFLEEKLDYSDIHYENGQVEVKKLTKKL